MWMAGLDWDEELTEPLTNAAQAWFSELSELTQLQIPRCLLVGGKQIDNVSLHTFVDASEDAFGAVAYVRYRYQNGTISTKKVAAKTGPSSELCDLCMMNNLDLGSFQFVTQQFTGCPVFLLLSTVVNEAVYPC